MNEEILKEILQELKNIHFHLDNLETLYKFTNKVEIRKENTTENKK